MKCRRHDEDVVVVAAAVPWVVADQYVTFAQGAHRYLFKHVPEHRRKATGDPGGAVGRTHEQARLCVEHGAGVVVDVANHRRKRSAYECRGKLIDR